MALKHPRIQKVCSNCETPYNDSDPLPLCQECIKQLAGYGQFIQNAQLNSNHDPHQMPHRSFIDFSD